MGLFVGAADDNRPFRAILEKSPFHVVDQHTFSGVRQRDVDSVIGYLHSTSFAAARLFANRLDEFDAAARALLDGFATDGLLTDHNEFVVLLARRG